MNYIRHLNAVLELFHQDQKITPFHMSLYLALFQYWNANHFLNPISIAREETMRRAKIGSANTYTKCLKELHQWKYIEYFPSFNQHIGSKVHLYNYDKGSDKASTNLYDSDNASDNGGDKAPEKPLRPSINSNETNTNNKNNYQRRDVKKENQEKVKSLTTLENDFNPRLVEIDSEKKKVAQKKKNEEHLFSESTYFNKSIFKQALEETDYAHANLDYYHEIINNWSTSKGAKKKDWLATAKNWILRDFKEGKLVTEQTTQNGKSNASTESHYAELGNAVDEWFKRKYNS